MINFIVNLFEESIKMQSTLHEGIIRRFSSSAAKVLTGGTSAYLTVSRLFRLHLREKSHLKCQPRKYFPVESMSI